MHNKFSIFICTVLCLISVALAYRNFNLPKDTTFDETCSLADGSQGKCVNIKNCLSLGKPGELIKTCYFDKHDEIICCPTDEANANKEEKHYVKACQSYYPSFRLNPSSLKDPPQFILAGDRITYNEFPFMVALGWEGDGFEVDVDIYDYKCGGVLITADFVLTAAHCAFSPVVVLPGGIDIIDPEVRPHNISKIYVHPDYKKGEIYNDIAIIQLQEPVRKHKPACLWDNQLLDHLNVTALGYGTTGSRGQRSFELLKGSLRIIPNDECNGYFKPSPRNYRGIVQTQLCAKDPEKRQATCKGDSGGPIVIDVPDINNIKRAHVVGITSQGIGCSNSFPGVYTRISKYLDWIEKIVWNKV